MSNTKKQKQTKKVRRDKTITLVVSEEERNKLRALADENNRTLSSYIYYFLKDAKLI